MLMPKKVKYRKQQRGRMRGKAWRGSDVSFGDYGLKAMEPCWLTDRQIEAARVAMTRFIKRGGKIWVRVFPDKPITKKPQETRMGKGKGAPEDWVCVIKPGRILFEMEGVQRARSAPGDASWRRRSCRSRPGSRRGSPRSKCHDEGRGTERPDRRRAAARKEQELDDQLFRLRIQKSMGQLEAPRRCATIRRELARHQDDPREEGEVGMSHGAKQRSQSARSSATRCRRASSSPSSARCSTPLRQDAAAHVHVRRARRGERAKVGDTVAIAESAAAQQPQALGLVTHRRARKAQV